MDDLFVTLKAELAALMQSRSPAFLRQQLARGAYVYGAGGYGRRILHLLRAQGIACYGIIDRKFSEAGQFFEGVPASHPDMFKMGDVTKAVLVVGIHNPAPGFESIFKFAGAHDFSDILFNADLPDALGPQADNYWLTNRQFILDHFDRFVSAAKLLTEDKSVALLAALLRYRCTGQVSSGLKIDLNTQYYPPGMLKFGPQMTFVDGGAFDGGTYKFLMKQKLDIARWVAFEPDPKNFEALVAAAREEAFDTILFPCGLADKFQLLGFRPDQGTSSHLEAGGTITIPCVALDDVLRGAKVDYIKMDIEGAEPAALHGMAKTITKYQPALAVSAYHLPKHLYLVVEMLAEMAPYADLHIRQHGENAFDTVVYAVPRRG